MASWQHATMSSLEAMDHIDRMFLTIKESVWLPQWSFDFWFIPYALGKGIPVDEFKKFVSHAGKLLAMEVAYCPDEEKEKMQKTYLQQMADLARRWPVEVNDSPAFSGAAAAGMAPSGPQDLDSNRLVENRRAH